MYRFSHHYAEEQYWEKQLLQEFFPVQAIKRKAVVPHAVDDNPLNTLALTWFKQDSSAI